MPINRSQLLLTSEKISREVLTHIINKMIDGWEESNYNLSPDIDVYVIDDMEPEE